MTTMQRLDNHTTSRPVTTMMLSCHSKIFEEMQIDGTLGGPPDLKDAI